MNLNTSQIRLIDALLPQTQCGLCGHRDGCLPYAISISQGEDENKCIPGGQPVSDALSDLLKRPKKIAESSVWPIQADGRPQRMKAVIREDECIGCTKCINACPVDAIIGSGKLMHSIFSDLCTGCELCIPPCPVDCIDLIEDPSPIPSESEQISIQNDLRNRYYAHIVREDQRKAIRKGPVVRAEIDSRIFYPFMQAEALHVQPAEHTAPMKPIDAKNTIEMAKLRTAIKKLEKQLSVREDAQKRAMLNQHISELANLEQG